MVQRHRHLVEHTGHLSSFVQSLDDEAGAQSTSTPVGRGNHKRPLLRIAPTRHIHGLRVEQGFAAKQSHMSLPRVVSHGHGAVAAQVHAAAIGQARVADRRAFVDPTADLADDPLADVHQLGVVAEADIGQLDLAGHLDEHPARAIDHDVGDVVAGQQRLQRAVAEYVVADVVEQFLLLGDRHHHRLQRDDVADDVADFLARRLDVELGELAEVDGLDQRREDRRLDGYPGASGAYYIASAADEIIVNPSSLVGSIGVIMPNYGVNGLMQKLGVEDRTMTSGENKAILSMTQPVDPAQKAHVQGVLDNVHDHFINAVKQGRGKKLKSNDPAIFSGLFWTGEQAVKLGIADRVGSLNTLKRELKTDKAVNYTIEYSPFDSVLGRMGSSIGQGFASSLSQQVQSENQTKLQ